MKIPVFIRQLFHPPSPPDRLLRYHFALTDACNLNCSFCWRRRRADPDRKWVHASDEVVEQWLGMIRSDLEVVHPGGGGEPLLHPRFGDFITRCLRVQKTNPAEQPDIRIVTNGTLIDRWPILLEAFATGRLALNVSLVSADADRYHDLRGGASLEKVAENLRAVRAARERGKNLQPRTRVKLNTILTRENAAQASQMIEFARNLRMDRVNFKRLHPEPCQGADPAPDAPVLDPAQVSSLRKLKLRHDSPDFTVGFFGFPGLRDPAEPIEERLPCNDLFQSLRFYPDGEVYTCCLVRTPTALAGNILQTDATAIWQSERLVLAREKILAGQPGSFCSTCPHVRTIPRQAEQLRRKYGP